MFCKQCGAELPDNAKFCIACGSKVIAHNKTKSKSVNEPKKGKSLKAPAAKSATQKTKTKPETAEPVQAKSKPAPSGKKAQQNKPELGKAMKTVFFVMAGLMAVLILTISGLLLFTDVFNKKSEAGILVERESLQSDMKGSGTFSADYSLAYLYPVDLLGVWEYDGPAEDGMPMYVIYPNNKVNIIFKNENGEIVGNYEEECELHEDYIMISDSGGSSNKLYRQNDEMISIFYADEGNESDEFVYKKQDVSIDTYNSYKNIEAAVERTIVQFDVPQGQIPASDVIFNREWVFVGLADNTAIDDTGVNYSIENENPDIYQSLYFHEDLTACRAILLENDDLIWEIYYLEPLFDVGYKTVITPDQSQGLAFVVGDDNMLYACWYEYREASDQPGQFVEFPMSDNMVFAPIEYAGDYGVKLKLFENGELVIKDDMSQNASIISGTWYELGDDPGILDLNYDFSVAYELYGDQYFGWYNYDKISGSGSLALGDSYYTISMSEDLLVLTNDTEGSYYFSRNKDDSLFNFEDDGTPMGGVGGP